MQVLLNEERFDWEISGGSLVVSALGMCPSTTWSSIT